MRTRDPIAELLRTTVAAAQAEALDSIRARLRAAMEDAWWPEACALAGLDPSGERIRGAAPPPTIVAPERVTPPSAVETHATETGELLYVYGFMRASARPVGHTHGIEPGTSVELIATDDVCALVTRVRSDAYSEHGLRAHLTDPDWLAPRVRAHDAVLRTAAEVGPVLPMRFCIVYRDDARVRQLLGQNRSLIASELARLEGHREWGVKIHMTSPALALVGDAAERSAALRAEVTAATPGRAHFARRRVERLEAEARALRADELGTAAHEALAAVSAEAARLAVQPTSVSGRTEPQILHGAYLVKDARHDAFQIALEHLSKETGLEVQCTGPWPPFHFSRVELLDLPPARVHG
jgi:hypothetical protein